MSRLTAEGCISVKPFAAVPALAGLDQIDPVPTSWSAEPVSSAPVPARGGVHLSEGCLVTKCISYTHQLAHWVNAGRVGSSSRVVSKHFMIMRQFHWWLQLLIIFIS